METLYGHEAVLRLLLEHKAEINAALYWVISNGRGVMAQQLEHMANIGGTLYRAASNGHEAVCGCC